MNESDFNYHWGNLEALDPDQLVADLGLTTEDLLDAFSYEAQLFIEKEYG